jgi:hypothetical protein
MSTVPIFAPDGTLGDIPPEQLVAAVKAGAKPGVHFKAPDGSMGIVPADRVSDAVKGGGTILPFESQEVKHPGFWANLGSDLAAMVTPKPGALGKDALPGRVAAGEQQRLQDNAQIAADTARRTAAGYSAPYRALAPVAEGLGVNVPGMEESAVQGDVAGVAGHAAAVPTVMAATEGAVRGVGAIPESVRTAPVRLTARATETAVNQKLLPVKPVLHIMTPADEAGALQLKVPGRDYGLPTTAAEPSPPASALDATAENRAYAGEPPPAAAPKVPAKTLRQSRALAPQPLEQARALKTSTDSVIDQHIPAEGDTYGHNLQTKAAVDFHLRRGDVAGAEAALDDAAARTNPQYQPPTGRAGNVGEGAPSEVQATGRPEAEASQVREVTLRNLRSQVEQAATTGDRMRALKALSEYENPGVQERPPGQVEALKTRKAGEPREEDIPEHMQGETPTVVPAVQNIRENLAQAKAAETEIPLAMRDRGNLIEDRAIQQEMAQNLKEHGSRAESEARREFIARNSTGVTKGDLIKQGTIAKTPEQVDDLTPEWTKALNDIIKRKQGAQ